MGFYLRVIQAGDACSRRPRSASAVLIAAIALGGVIDDSSLADTFSLSPETLALCLIGYGFVASVLPVWMLLAPRDYLSTFMKIGVIELLAVGIIVTLPVMQNEAVTPFASSGEGTRLRRRPVPVRVRTPRRGSSPAIFDHRCSASTMDRVSIPRPRSAASRVTSPPRRGRSTYHAAWTSASTPGTLGVVGDRVDVGACQHRGAVPSSACTYFHEAGQDAERSLRWSHRNERTREIGMLRAVGATARQVRQIIRYESVITAASVGCRHGDRRALRLALDVRPRGPRRRLQRARRSADRPAVLAVVVGIGAVVPARRASRLDVLDAISRGE